MTSIQKRRIAYARSMKPEEKNDSPREKGRYLDREAKPREDGNREEGR